MVLWSESISICVAKTGYVIAMTRIQFWPFLRKYSLPKMLLHFKHSMAWFRFACDKGHLAIFKLSVANEKYTCNFTFLREETNTGCPRKRY